MNTAKMTASALRSLMGDSFDYSEFEQGRKDAHNLFRKQPEIKAEKIDEAKRVLEHGDYRHRPGPSYWIGCLCEADFS